MTNSGSESAVLPRRELDQIDSPLRDMLQPMAERLGYFGEMLQLLSNSEPSLTAFMRYTSELRSELPLNLVEVIALTVSSRMGFDYERIQHERLSLKSGFDRRWIAAAIGKGSTQILSPVERLTADIAGAVATHRFEAARDDLRQLAELEGPGVAATTLFQVTRQVSVALMGRVLEPGLPVSSIFELDDADTDSHRNHGDDNG